MIKWLLPAILLLALLPGPGGENAPAQDCVSCIPRLRGAVAKNTPLLHTAAQMAKPAKRAPAERGSREEQMIARIGRALCRSYSHNDFTLMQKILRRSSQRLLGRVVELEEVYPHLQCYQVVIGDVDLLRVTAQNPIETAIAVRELMHYLVTRRGTKPFWAGSPPARGISAIAA